MTEMQITALRNLKKYCTTGDQRVQMGHIQVCLQGHHKVPKRSLTRSSHSGE